MRLFFLLLSVAAYELIPSAVRLTPLVFYYDSKILPLHRNAFTEALKSWSAGDYFEIQANYALQGLYSKQDGINTITYSNNTSIAATSIYASYNHECGKWVVSEMDMIVNQYMLVDYNASVNAFKHELGHIQLLEHNGVNKSLMNNSIIVNTRGLSVPDNIWDIHPDDKYGAYLTYMAGRRCHDILNPT
jgi:hypothetical protein